MFDMTATRMLRAWADGIARGAAKEAHEEMFSSRRGFYEIEGGRVLIYNNNPYSGDESLRDREMARTLAILEGRGAEFLAEAYYPEGTRYTMTMLLLVPDGVADLVGAVGADSAGWAMH